MKIEKNNPYLGRQSEYSKDSDTCCLFGSIGRGVRSFLNFFEPIAIFFKNLRYDCFGPRNSFCERSTCWRKESSCDNLFGNLRKSMPRHFSQSTVVTTQN